MLYVYIKCKDQQKLSSRQPLFWRSYSFTSVKLKRIRRMLIFFTSFGALNPKPRPLILFSLSEVGKVNFVGFILSFYMQTLRCTPIQQVSQRFIHNYSFFLNLHLPGFDGILLTSTDNSFGQACSLSSSLRRPPRLIANCRRVSISAASAFSTRRIADIFCFLVKSSASIKVSS